MRKRGTSQGQEGLRTIQLKIIKGWNTLSVGIICIVFIFESINYGEVDRCKCHGFLFLPTIVEISLHALAI